MYVAAGVGPRLDRHPPGLTRLRVDFRLGYSAKIGGREESR
jgi:hypothetical protein